MFLLTVPPLITVFHTDGVIMCIKGQTIRKVTGVGLGKVKKKKKFHAKENWVKKNSRTGSSPEKKFLHMEKKNSCKGNVNEKNMCSSKIPPLPTPITFLMVHP